MVLDIAPLNRAQ